MTDRPDVPDSAVVLAPGHAEWPALPLARRAASPTADLLTTDTYRT